MASAALLASWSSLLHGFFGILAPNLDIPYLHPITDAFFGGAGVDLFFVLSGFLIGGILIDHRESPNYFKVFWVRRAARILPVYFLLFATYGLALSVSQLVTASWFHEWLMQDPIPLWTYFTFTQNYFMAAENSGAARWVGITWSLAVEEQFYLIFPFVVYFLSKRAVIGLALVTIILAPFIRTHLWHHGFYTGYFPTPARADGLMFGVLVAYAVRTPALVAFCRQWGPIGDGVFTMAAVVLTWLPGLLSVSEQFTLRSAIFAYLIARIFFTDGWMRTFLRTRFMVFMGAISYPFYMYHQAINGMFHGVILGQVPKIENSSGIAVAIAVLLTAGSLATLSTLYYERPFRRLGKQAKYLPACANRPFQRDRKQPPSPKAWNSAARLDYTAKRQLIRILTDWSSCAGSIVQRLRDRAAESNLSGLDARTAGRARSELSVTALQGLYPTRTMVPGPKREPFTSSRASTSGLASDKRANLIRQLPRSSAILNQKSRQLIAKKLNSML